MKRFLLFVSALLLAVSLLPMMAAAQVQKTNTDLPVDDYLTLTNYPCLPETIHLTGVIHEQDVFVLNANIAHFTRHQSVDLNAVGVPSGVKYIFQGPLTQTATYEVPYQDLPLEFTSHNSNHFIAPGSVNLYINEVMHGMWDPETGALRLWLDKIAVVCK